MARSKPFAFLVILTTAVLAVPAGARDGERSAGSEPPIREDGSSRPERPASGTSIVLAGLADTLAASTSATEQAASPFLPPGHGGTPPGQGGTPPGQTTPPGKGGTPPGQGGTAPGQGGGPPPGHRS